MQIPEIPKFLMNSHNIQADSRFMVGRIEYPWLYARKSSLIRDRLESVPLRVSPTVLSVESNVSRELEEVSLRVRRSGTEKYVIMVARCSRAFAIVVW